MHLYAFKLSLLIRYKAQLNFIWAISIPSTVAGKVPIGIIIGGILMVIVIKKTYRGNVSVVQFAWLHQYILSTLYLTTRHITVMFLARHCLLHAIAVKFSAFLFKFKFVARGTYINTLPRITHSHYTNPRHQISIKPAYMFSFHTTMTAAWGIVYKTVLFCCHRCYDTLSMFKRFRKYKRQEYYGRALTRCFPIASFSHLLILFWLYRRSNSGEGGLGCKEVIAPP